MFTECQESLRQGCVLFFCFRVPVLFLHDGTLSAAKVCNLFFELWQQEALSNCVAFFRCASDDEKNIHYLYQKLIFECSEPSIPLYITPGVFQLNETMFWYNGCVLKGVLLFHCGPSLTRGALHTLFT